MKFRRPWLLCPLMCVLAAGCETNPIQPASRTSPKSVRDIGVTLGSGHKSGDSTNTAATASVETVAPDSSSSAFNGQTLGSGH